MDANGRGRALVDSIGDLIEMPTPERQRLTKWLGLLRSPEMHIADLHPLERIFIAEGLAKEFGSLVAHLMVYFAQHGDADAFGSADEKTNAAAAKTKIEDSCAATNTNNADANTDATSEDEPLLGLDIMADAVNDDGAAVAGAAAVISTPAALATDAAGNEANSHGGTPKTMSPADKIQSDPVKIQSFLTEHGADSGGVESPAVQVAATFKYVTPEPKQKAQKADKKRPRRAPGQKSALAKASDKRCRAKRTKNEWTKIESFECVAGELAMSSAVALRKAPPGEAGPGTIEFLLPEAQVGGFSSSLCA